MKSNSEENTVLTIGKIPYYYFGIVGSMIILISFLISGLAYGNESVDSYSILNHFVSELGNVGVSDLAIVFNVGLAIGGLLLVIFMLGFGTVFKTRLGKIARIIGILAAFFAALVGLFPMNNLIPHAIVAMAFFYLGMISVFLFTIEFARDPNKLFPKSVIGFGIIVFVCFFIFHFVPLDQVSMDFDQVFSVESDGLNLDDYRPEIWGMAFMEWLVIIGVLIWILIVAIILAMKDKKQSD
jgi:hypothetical membrane protein